LRYDVAMTLRISRAAYDALLAEADGDPHREVCGLLLGDDHVTRIVPTPNVAADPEKTFEIEPQALFAAIRNERAGAASLIGYYHSHPRGHALPSAQDTLQAQGDRRIWVIVAGGAVTAWRIDASDRFVQLSVEPID
jgi:desampylase